MVKINKSDITKLRDRVLTDLDELPDDYYTLEFKVIKQLPGWDKKKWKAWQYDGSNDEWAQTLMTKANKIIVKQFIG